MDGCGGVVSSFSLKESVDSPFVASITQSKGSAMSTLLPRELGALFWLLLAVEIDARLETGLRLSTVSPSELLPVPRAVS